VTFLNVGFSFPLRSGFAPAAWTTKRTISPPKFVSPTITSASCRS
jgi:hypothetical protein